MKGKGIEASIVVVFADDMTASFDVTHPGRLVAIHDGRADRTVAHWASAATALDMAAGSVRICDPWLPPDAGLVLPSDAELQAMAAELPAVVDMIGVIYIAMDGEERLMFNVNGRGLLQFHNTVDREASSRMPERFKLLLTVGLLFEWDEIVETAREAAQKDAV